MINCLITLELTFVDLNCVNFAPAVVAEEFVGAVSQKPLNTQPSRSTV